MKKMLNLFLLIVFCLGVGRVWYWATDGFRLSRIAGFDRVGIERDFSNEAKDALSQRYYYLDRGRQCFAFESEDGKYVIKFPRLDRYKDSLMFRLSPFDFFKAYIDRIRNNHITRKAKLFDSFEISFDELKEDTALVAMFNAPKKMEGAGAGGAPIEIVDRLGRVSLLPLEKTGFILQRKLHLFKDVFQEALAKKDMVEVGKILDRLLEVVVRVAEKGILSKDGSFLNNFAFDETRCFQIDVGSFYRTKDLSPEEAFNASIHASVETLRVWLLHLDPALLELIDRKLGPIYER